MQRAIRTAASTLPAGATPRQARRPGRHHEQVPRAAELLSKADELLPRAYELRSMSAGYGAASCAGASAPPLVSQVAARSAGAPTARPASPDAASRVGTRPPPRSPIAAAVPARETGAAPGRRTRHRQHDELRSRRAPPGQSLHELRGAHPATHVDDGSPSAVSTHAPTTTPRPSFTRASSAPCSCWTRARVPRRSAAATAAPAPDPPRDSRRDVAAAPPLFPRAAVTWRPPSSGASALGRGRARALPPTQLSKRRS
jgi:hypothetical protein